MANPVDDMLAQAMASMQISSLQDIQDQINTLLSRGEHNVRVAEVDYILEQINQRTYDLYLLCDIDLPWAADEMREYPDAGPRLELFTIYKELLINQNTPWGIVSGTGAQRTTNAIQLIDQHL